MQFDLESSRHILQRTPSTLAGLVRDLPEGWVRHDEGPGTWSVFDVVGHLIHGERTDWMPRARIILEQGPRIPFEPIDRVAQLKASEGRSLTQLLDEFSVLRAQNLDELAALRLAPEQFELEGRHPELGRVTPRPAPEHVGRARPRPPRSGWARDGEVLHGRSWAMAKVPSSSLVARAGSVLSEQAMLRP